VEPEEKLYILRIPRHYCKQASKIATGSTNTTNCHLVGFE